MRIVPKADKVDIGDLRIDWSNYLGEPGKITLGPLSYRDENARDILVEVVGDKKEAALFVEQPATVLCRVINASQRTQ